MKDNGFNKACPSGNHMVNGETPYDYSYPNLSIGDILTNKKTNAHWEVTDVEREFVVLAPADEEITVSYDELEHNFTS